VIRPQVIHVFRKGTMMSTFERMLQALQARRESAGDAGARPSRSAGHHRNRRAKRTPECLFGSRLESLEQRQLLAISTYATLPSGSGSGLSGGLVTIVAEPGDSVFIQQVAGLVQAQPGQPQNNAALYISNNSSFQGRTVVGGPAIVSASPGAFKNQLLAGTDFENIDQIIITSGTKRVETTPQLVQNYPMFRENVTQFGLSEPGLSTSRTISGVMTLVNEKGVPEQWDFTNNGNGNPVFTSGIGITRPAEPGDVYPRPRITAVGEDNSGYTSERSGLQVTWNVPTLSRVPELKEVNWFQAHASRSGSQVQKDVRPVAPAERAVISLPNATGPGLNPILTSSFSAQLILDGQSFSLTTDKSGAIYFNGQLRPVWDQRFVTTTTGTQTTRILVFERFATGSLLDGSQQDPITKEYRRGIQLTTSGPMPMSLVSAEYALAAGGAPVAATVFAGQNITAGLDINLLSPGSEINIDSPVVVPSTRQSLGVSLRASTVELNAPVTVNSQPAKTANNTETPGRSSSVVVGSAVGINQLGFETARGVAGLVDGKVTSLVVANGFGGAGYSAASPPVVTLAAPANVNATVLVTGVVNASVVSISVLSGGAGYEGGVPGVVIDPPEDPNGTFAQGVAVVDTESKSVVGINLVNGGSGYNSAPTVAVVTTGTTKGRGATARAVIAGSLSTDFVFVQDGGFGYARNSTTVPIIITGRGRGAEGFAITDDRGQVTRVNITKGGSGYDPLNVGITIPAPVRTEFNVATAEAIVDPVTTRVTGFKLTNPGLDYGQIPLVTIAPPLAATAAGRTVVKVDGGKVTTVNFASGKNLQVTVQAVTPTGEIQAAFVAFGAGGDGYEVGDVVTIDATAPGLGRSAQFRILQVNRSGSVERLEVIGGGRNYAPNARLAHDGKASRGLGYAAAPRVFVGRPDDPNGIQAKVVAVLDAAGSVTGFTIEDGGSGYTDTAPPRVTVAPLLSLATAEIARFNARVGADQYDIDLANDPFTLTDRAQLLVSQGGSLVSDRVTGRASAVRVEVHQGDVLVEGTINAADQSYLLQSSVEDQLLAPFRFTTEASSSGVQTGRILGDNVAVTLANDLPTPVDGSVAFNVVALQTDVRSLRIRAARASGQNVPQPFPYQLSIDEQSDLDVDALAASSFPISFKAAGSLNFNAALSTAGGFAITADGNLKVNAPVSTTFGQIALTGKGLDVGASLRVTSEPSDTTRQDIVLDSLGGAISLRGGEIAAPGRVVIRQKTGRVPQDFTYNAASAPRSFYGGQTLSVPIGITDNFTFDELSLSISLAVTNPAYRTVLDSKGLGGLSANLESPSGAKYELFPTGSLSGTAITNAVFTPAATVAIGSSKEPYTGSFRPASAAALEQLYNRSVARGTWKLNLTTEERSLKDTQIGSLSAVSLTLRNPTGGRLGDVYGSSRVVANSLLIDAEGAVGNPSVQPNHSEYYLQTDVSTVEGSAGGSFALADSNQVDIVGLRAEGLVSLRSNGVDLPDGRAALRATLLDVTALELNAPAGSIDVEVTTSSSVAIGNAKLLSLATQSRTGLSSMTAAGNVTVRTAGGSQGGEIVVLDAPVAGSSSRPVRFVLPSSLSSGTYIPGLPGTFPDRIEARANTALGDLFSGSPTVSIGDRILVAGGVTNVGEKANGVYVVRQAGGSGSKWQLVRAVDADTLGELPTRTFVRALEGDKAGQAYQIVHAITTPSRFGSDPIAVRPVSLVTNIGSDDPSDPVTFVVSTMDGTNSSPGSLGKMISLRQLNDTSKAPSNPAQVTDFVFSDTISAPIQLAQELPVITKAFAIDGRRRLTPSLVSRPITVDGSRVSTTRTGRSVGVTSSVDGFVFDPSSGSPVAASGAILANVNVGGFNRGAAVKVNGAQNVVLSGVSAGLDDQGGRASNQKSVVITSAVVGGTNGVTIANSVIAGGAIAGLSLEGQASGVLIYGTKIGVANASNTVGISMSSSGKNTLGSISFAKNFISNNGTGMVLATGAVTMINTQVSGNAADGIRINGGAHVIGKKPRDTYANAIFGNGGFGVSFRDAVTAQKQVVVGNLIGAAGLNTKGNVGVGVGAAPVALGYVPNAKTGVDSKENLHLTVVATPPKVTPGKPVARPPVRTPTPWRPRR